MAKRTIIIIAVLGVALLAADHFYYRPMKADELRREEEQRARCLSTLADIQKEGGDAAKEQIGGRLAGCDFGSPLG